MFVGVCACVCVIFHVRNCVFIGTLYNVLDVQKCILSCTERIICLSCNFYVKWCTVGTDICTVDVVISSFNYSCCNCVSGYY